MANQGPAETTFFMWPKSEDDEDENTDEDDEQEEEEVAPGSLQAILDGLGNEKAKAVHEALNPPHELVGGCRIISAEEIRRRIDDASKPYLEKMEEARQEFVVEGSMTVEEAKLVIGYDDQMKKDRKKAKKDLQNNLNRLQKEMNKAVQLALHPEMTEEGKELTIAEVSKPFEEKMDEVRGAFERYCDLTTEETKAIVPNVAIDAEDDGENSKEGRREKDKDVVYPRVVTDEGFPVTKPGMERFFEINQEVGKRDQDQHDMYIFNDFSGYGVTEVLENTLIEFNKLIFKKDVSPLKKWALVEGLITYLAMSDHMLLMMTDDSDGVGEVFDIMGVMFITTLKMLHEAALIGPDSPLPDNIGVMTLFFLDFMKNTASDFDIEWIHEVVRSADMFGVVLSPLKQVAISQETLDDLRQRCEEEKRGKGFAWKTEYPKFKRNHPGGDQYDITKMAKKQRAKYKFRDDSDSDI